MQRLEMVNGVLKMFWASVIIIVFLGMSIWTKDPAWLWGLVIGGGFLGIKSLGTIAQSLAIAAGGAVEDSKPPKTVITTDPRLAGMGGSLTDQFKSPISAMLNYVKLVVIGVVILVILVAGGNYIYQINHKLTVAQQKLELISPEILPDDVEIRAVAKKGQTIVSYKDKSGKTQQIVVPHPKDSTSITRELKNGEVKVNKVKEMLPHFTTIPHVSVVVGKEADAGIGVTVARSDGLGVNANIDVLIKSIGISLTKDIMSNSSVGVFYGTDYHGQERVGVKFGVNF